MFPKLYSKASTGKEKVWEISARGDTIYMTHGYTDGALQVSERKMEPKNIGKKNETSAEEQAVKEAEARWKRKLKEGYAERNAAPAELVPWAMLAHEYSKRGHNIVFPCLWQPKLDGARALYKNGEFFSRDPEKKRYDHLLPELALLDFPWPLDGEIYSYEMPFEELVGISNKVHLSEEDVQKVSLLNFYVFDCVAPMDFEDRYKLLEAGFANRGRGFSKVFLVDTLECESADDVTDLMNSVCYEEGCEGIMLRNKKGEYASGFRSPNLQKCKPFKDSEYEIVGYKCGKGKASQCVIWQCATPEGACFWAKMACSDEESARLLNAAESHIGKYLTVKYQDITTAGVPRFPVGKCIRWK
jgi:ATP-dependent DNA ligase